MVYSLFLHQMSWTWAGFIFASGFTSRFHCSCLGHVFHLCSSAPASPVDELSSFKLGMWLSARSMPSCQSITGTQRVPATLLVLLEQLSPSSASVPFLLPSDFAGLAVISNVPTIFPLHGCPVPAFLIHDYVSSCSHDRLLSDVSM